MLSLWSIRLLESNLSSLIPILVSYKWTFSYSHGLSPEQHHRKYIYIIIHRTFNTNYTLRDKSLLEHYFASD